VTGRAGRLVAAGLAFAAGRAGAAAPAAESRYDREIDRAVASASAVYPVPRELVKAVIRAESDFDARAVSRAGAVGLMQILPSTGRRLGIPVADLADPARNVEGGVRLLAVLLRRYRGDVVSALVAYNARPRPRFAPIPRNGETPAYVRAVLSNLRRYARPAPPGGSR